MANTKAKRTPITTDAPDVGSLSDINILTVSMSALS
jgi:hypothetical protein